MSNARIIRHRWDSEGKSCINCGVKRKRKSWKRLMAIVNHPPWEGYERGVDWAYSTDGKTWKFKRPNCISKNEYFIR